MYPVLRSALRSLSICVVPSQKRPRLCENAVRSCAGLVGWVMRHIQGSDRAQSLLLPASVEDCVAEDNPVRATEAFVDGCDLQKAGFVRAQAKDTGRPGYHPADLLKLYLYGYLNRVRSSRRLEAECRRDLEVLWLLRGLRPGFNHRRLPARERPGLQGGLPPLRAALPPA